jgi:flagellar basal body-associated protein FliL
MQLGSILGIVGGFVGIVGLMIILFLFISKKSETKKALKSVDDRVSVTAYSRPNIFTSKVTISYTHIFLMIT